ncbi:hypothetical protein DFJ73DRAFT_838743 [Zopfochytrium polystomum]|nr:hypothetical protein DFJ73DRAFT_838743 [Zopfochytrium polystomum]
MGRLAAVVPEVLASIVLYLNGQDMLVLRSVSRSVFENIEGGVMRSTSFAIRHVKRWIARALDSGQTFEDAATAWGSVYEGICFLRKEDERLRSSDIGIKVACHVGAEPWPKLPACYWAAVILLLRLDIRLLSFFTGTTLGSADGRDMDELCTSVKRIGPRLRPALLEVARLTRSEVDIPQQSELKLLPCFSACVGVLNDASLFDKISHRLQSKQLHLDTDIAIVFALRAGSNALALHLLATHPSTATAMNGFPLQFAVQEDRREILDCILASGRADLGSVGYRASLLRFVAATNRAHTARLLLAAPGFSPALDNCNAVRVAIAGRCVEVFEAFVEHAGQLPVEFVTAADGPVSFAVTERRPDLVHEIVKRRSDSAGKIMDTAMVVAIKLCDPALFDQLIELPGVDFGNGFVPVFRLAVERDHFALVERILNLMNAKNIEMVF